MITFDGKNHKNFPCIEVSATHNGAYIDMIVKTIGRNGQPECQVGNKLYNYWYKTPAAKKTCFEGYRTLGALKTAVTRTLRTKGFENIRYRIEGEMT